MTTFYNPSGLSLVPCTILSYRIGGSIEIRRNGWSQGSQFVDADRVYEDGDDRVVITRRGKMRSYRLKGEQNEEE